MAWNGALSTAAPLTRRILAVGFLVVVFVVVAVALLRGAGDYVVSARFINAGQLVEGNLVTVAGEPVGTVKAIELSPDGRADVEFDVDEPFSPLRTGTRAVIRKSSLSSAAGDYIALQLGPAEGEDIPDEGTIPGIATTSDVPLDAVINTFDPAARVAVSDTIRFLRNTTRGNEDRANAALQYLNPALSASSRLFRELDRNRPDLERFIDANAKLTTDLSSQDDALAGLVANLSTTMRAIASERGSLDRAIGSLPGFLRRANTTFAGLRSTLDDVDPLVDAARPVVGSRLRPLFAQLRPLARDIRPTARDLSLTIRRPGADNDLVELLRAQPAIDAIANRTARRAGADRPGAFPAMQAAAKGATPQFAFARPYSPELVGWFDDFSSSGAYDALGGFSRAGLALNQFTFLPALNAILPVPPELRDALEAGTLKTGLNNRCPGSLERPADDGSNPFLPTSDFNCNPLHVPFGR